MSTSERNINNEDKKTSLKLDELNSFLGNCDGEHIFGLFDFNNIECLKLFIKRQDYTSGLTFLYRCLRDKDPSPEELNERFELVKTCINDQGKFVSYFSKFKNQIQTNQFLGSLFELNIQSLLIRNSKKLKQSFSVEIEPIICIESNSSLDCSVSFGKAKLYFECKALGYSKNINCKDSFSMKMQVWNALSEKLLQGKQICNIDSTEKTILCLALNEMGCDDVYAKEAIEEFLVNDWTCNHKEKIIKNVSNVSAIVLFGSCYVRRDLWIFENKKSSMSLNSLELDILRKSLHF